MKHIMKFESKFAPVSGPESYDVAVKQLFEELKNACDLSKFKEETLHQIFDMIQEEFDTSDDTKLYAVYQQNRDTDIFIGIFKAYGPNHAKVRAAISEENNYFLKLSHIPTISEKAINNKIKNIEISLNKWKDIL